MNNAHWIGQRLRACRESAGLSQKYVAKRVNVDASTISNYERGRRAVSSDVLQALAALYGVSTGHLMDKPSDTPKLPVRYYAVKKPYMPLWNRVTVPFSILWILSLNAYVFFESFNALLIWFFVTVFLAFYHIYRIFFYENGQDELIPVYNEGESIAYVKENGEKDAFGTPFVEILLWLALLSSLLFFMSLVIDSLGEVDMVVFSALTVFYILFFIYMFVTVASGKTVKEVIADKWANKRLNTYKFLVLKVVSIVIYAFFSVAYGEILHGGGLTETWLMPVAYLLLQLHLILSWLYANEKLRLFASFTVKRREAHKDA